MQSEDHARTKEIASKTLTQLTVGPRTLSRAAGLGVALLLLTPLATAQTNQNAQQSNDTLPLTQPGSREEIMELLSRVQDELDAIPEGERNASSPRYLELRTQLKLLLLQAELERVRDENETLQTQLKGAPEPSAGAESASVTDQLSRIKTRLENFDAQLGVVMEQHAEILGTAAEAPAQEASATESAGGSRTGIQSYTIEQGDTLSRISLEAYGTPYRWPEIFDANPILTDPHLLPVGAVLLIP